VIYEVTPEDWKELVMNADLFPGFIFRGQTSYQWELSTTIERLTLQFGIREMLGMLENREFWILTEFRRRAHNLIGKPPKYDELIEWLALIQHHGGPTRLLDFTKSLLVGLFFACDGATEDAALWLINYHNLLSSHVPLGEDETIYHQQSALLDKATKIVGKENKESGIIPIIPERLSERMSIQQGISIMPMNIKKTFMDNLSSHYGWEGVRYKKLSFTDFTSIRFVAKTSVVKIKIRAAWFPRVLHYLDNANINANTLFPGLDGFARSLKIHLFVL
jgi:hypothetical protein